MNRQELGKTIRSLSIDSYASNIKFFKLLVSRLDELDIPHEDSIKIAQAVKYDFSNIPEDNDSLSEVATDYADYCLKVWKCIKVNGIKDITPLLKYFGELFLHIDHL